MNMYKKLFWKGYKNYILRGGSGKPESTSETTSVNILESCATPSHPAQTNVNIILKSQIPKIFW